MLALAINGLSASTTVACSRPMSIAEMVRQSEAIAVCRVVSAQSRWNENHTLIVTDYRIAVIDMLLGKALDHTITLTFAGGRVGEVGHSLCSMPQLQVDEVQVLFIQSLQSATFCPITGWEQGVFRFGDADGDALLRTDGSVAQNEHSSPISLRSLRESIAANAPSAPFQFIPDMTPSQLPCKTYVAASGIGHSAQKTPASNPRPNADPSVKSRERWMQQGQGTLIGQGSPSSNMAGNNRWEYEHRAISVPIVFEAFPETAEWYPWSPYDQYQMSHWNVYSDIFRVQAQPDGLWGHQNGQYELAGWIDNTAMQSNFGYSWDPNTYAVCFNTWNGDGWGIEADIAYNPDQIWTTSDFDTYNSNMVNFNQTTVHELGHAWGLQHQFNALSVMNYQQNNYRVYGKTYIDDVAALRDAFQSNGTNMTGADVSVSLHYSNGYQSFADCDLSTYYVPAGGMFSFTNMIVENLGPNTAAAPMVDWYLCPYIFNASWEEHYIGWTTLNQMNGMSWDIWSMDITVPDWIPTGQYYLNVRLTGQDTEWRNDQSWLHTPIWVENSIVSTGSTLTSDDHVVLTNPVLDGQLFVQLPESMTDGRYRIMDGMGRLTAQGAVGSGRLQVDVSGYASGMYHLSIEPEDKDHTVSTRKFMITN